MADNVAVFEVKQYMVIWRQVEIRDFEGIEVRIRGIVRCFGDEHTMDLMFLAEDSNIPAPTYHPDQKKGYMFLPMSDLTGMVDLLRNEKPIYAHLRGDKPEWTSITTSNEPVGEGEE